ncbi:MAG TPA: prepilin-type N-terminal cleavage/methylation domain-containing protein [Candidatus Paceibacterota bacterium]|nr:prepilin-type N-terminal cleavage/methylation domain-containing protein [Candidatus Paceibacterota bacterium]
MNLAPISVRRGHLKGFTLIELLVVIAIIGILSSVVLASLNTARNKGADAAIKSNLSAARAEAEIYYDSAGNYQDPTTAATGVCGSVANNIMDSATAAGRVLSSTFTVTRDADGGATVVSCNDTTAGWAIQAPLKTLNGANTQYYCVDSSGAALESTTDMITAATDVTC